MAGKWKRDPNTGIHQWELKSMKEWDLKQITCSVKLPDCTCTSCRNLFLNGECKDHS